MSTCTVPIDGFVGLLESSSARWEEFEWDDCTRNTTFVHPSVVEASFVTANNQAVTSFVNCFKIPPTSSRAQTPRPNEQGNLLGWSEEGVLLRIFHGFPQARAVVNLHETPIDHFSPGQRRLWPERL